jgi:aspartokinase
VLNTPLKAKTSAVVRTSHREMEVVQCRPSINFQGSRVSNRLQHRAKRQAGVGGCDLPQEALLTKSEKIAVGGMLQTRDLVLVQVLGARKGPGVAGKTLSTLGRRGINVIGVASFADINELGNICFAIGKDDLDQTLGLLQTIKEEIKAQHIEYVRHCCAISIYGPHFSERPSIAGRMFDALGEAGINIHMISTSISTVSCVIDQDFLQDALVRLRETFLVP